MSERGIEIHNGEIVFPEGMPQTLHLGTDASPLAQGEAGQVVLSGVINVTALGGTVYAAFFKAIGSVTATADLIGARGATTVNAGIVITGYAYGLHSNQEVLAAGQVTEIMDGIRIEQYVQTGGLTFTVHGIFISNFIQEQPSANYFFQRMSENGGVTVEAAFYISVGGTGDITDTFVLAGTHTAWSGEGNKIGVAHGWIKCRVGGVVRYIQLYY